MKNKGFFIAVEGIDGSGTTTFIAKLQSKLKSLNYKIHSTCEPSNLASGKLIRKLLSEESDNYVFSLLFAADRILHYKNEIVPALNQNKIVISDRYKMSSEAYQGSDEDLNFVKQLNSKVPEPDLLIFLEIDVNTASSRIDLRGKKREKLENNEFQYKVATAYQNLVTEYKYDKLILNARKSPEQLVLETVNFLKEKFGF